MSTRLWDKMYVGSAYYGRRGIAMQCISAIDNCLWSIRAQAAGMSLARLLGGRRRERVTAYASTLFRETPEAMDAAARGYVARGFRAVKFGWGVFGEDPGPRPRTGRRSARRRWAPIGICWSIRAGIRRLDKPGPMRSRREALALCEWLAEYGVGWVEDFIHPEHFEEYAYVRGHSPVPVAAGEQVATIWDFERFIGDGLRRRHPARPVALRRADRGQRRWPRLAERGRHRPRAAFLADASADRLQPAADRRIAAARFVEFNVSQSASDRGVSPGHPSISRRTAPCTFPTAGHRRRGGRGFRPRASRQLMRSARMAGVPPMRERIGMDDAIDRHLRHARQVVPSTRWLMPRSPARDSSTPE